mgnify:CR=1 FL=1
MRRVFLFQTAVVFGLLALMIAPAQAVVFNLTGPTDPIKAGATVSLDLFILNPDAEETSLTLSDELKAELSDGLHRWTVKLRAVAAEEDIAIKSGGFVKRGYVVELPATARDRLVLSLENPMAAKVALEVRDAPHIATVQPPVKKFGSPRPVEEALKRTFAGRFGAHDPIYFIYGDEQRAAKFQFSFKYRLLGEDAELGDRVPALWRLYFGYTQRSLWDIDADSSPFYDTSYLPELMFESQTVLDPDSPGGFKWIGYQAGLRHESNGRSGPTSRSINMVYFRPGVAFGRFDSWHVIVAPRISHSVSDLSNNPDIERYRGPLELQAVVGYSDGPSLTLTNRIGRDGDKGSLQADLNIPVKFDRLFDFATYMMIQYWQGYGESLLDYNVETSAVRIGFSLVR